MIFIHIQILIEGAFVIITVLTCINIIICVYIRAYIMYTSYGSTKMYIDTYRNGNGHGVIHNDHTSKLPPLTFTYIHTHTLSLSRSLSWARALSLFLSFSLSFSLSLALSRSRALALSCSRVCSCSLSYTHSHIPTIRDNL